MSQTKKSTITNPITGTEQLPADLLREAQAGTPFYKLTDAERGEFQNLSPALANKLSTIAHAAMVAHGALNGSSCDPDANVTSDAAADLLEQILGQRDDVTV